MRSGSRCLLGWRCVIETNAGANRQPPRASQRGIHPIRPHFVRPYRVASISDRGLRVSNGRRFIVSTPGPSVDSTTSVTEGTTTTLGSVTTTTVAATTTVATSSTTTTAPTTTTTTVYYAAAVSLYPPAGVWFGHVSAGAPTSVQFDLACWYFGDLAWEVADTYGDTAENDYYVVNQNPTLRTVPVGPGAVVHHIDAMSLGHDPIPYSDWLLEPEGYLTCPFDFCPLWLYVNDGEVTEIVEQYVP